MDQRTVVNKVGGEVVEVGEGGGEGGEGGGKGGGAKCDDHFRGFMSAFPVENLFPRGMTVQQFADTLARLGREEGVIERFDIDRPDPDNFAAVLLRIFQRRQLRCECACLEILRIFS